LQKLKASFFFAEMRVFVMLSTDAFPKILSVDRGNVWIRAKSSLVTLYIPVLLPFSGAFRAMVLD
jgi:hypothetical protein